MFSLKTRESRREWWKHALRISKAKLVYERITLTRFTTLYFFLALFTCITLVGLQTSTFFNNSEGATAVASFLRESNVTSTQFGLSFLQDGDVQLCKNIPGQSDSACSTLVHRAHNHMHVRADIPDASDLQQCAVSVMWLEDVLTDARREDLVVLAYQIWLFSLSVVTLLNESLPHLFAGLAARILATAWGGFRVNGNKNLFTTYYHVIKVGKCDGYDPLGDWWKQSDTHEVSILVCNVMNLVMMAALTYKLYTVYLTQTFSRVGASTKIHRIYVFVLVFSVLLQLAGFFTLAQSALWLGKIEIGMLRSLAEHYPIYLAGLIVTVFLDIPWLVVGWISVRRESRMLFIVFACISVILFGISTAMFVSPLYRFVLTSWSFFATMSGTAYVLVFATFILAIVCRLQFGHGLADFLRVAEALEGGDFDPVYFSKGDSLDEKKAYDFEHDPDLAVLEYSYSPRHEHADEEKEPRLPELAHAPSRLSQFLASDKTQSDTLKLSTTPPLFRNPLDSKRSSAFGGERPRVVIPSIANIRKAAVEASPIKGSPLFSATSPASASPSRIKGKRPPAINVPLATPEEEGQMYDVSVTPQPPRRTPTRSATLGEKDARDIAKPAEAVVRSRSATHQGPTGLPKRPNKSDSKLTKPSGSNFF